MTHDAWLVVLIVFVTMFLIQIGLFTWVEYLLLQIDHLDRELGFEKRRRTPRGGLA